MSSHICLDMPRKIYILAACGHNVHPDCAGVLVTVASHLNYHKSTAHSKMPLHSPIDHLSQKQRGFAAALQNVLLLLLLAAVVWSICQINL